MQKNFIKPVVFCTWRIFVLIPFHTLLLNTFRPFLNFDFEIVSVDSLI